MEFKDQDLSINVVAYEAPSVEYAAVASKATKKRKADVTETGRIQCCVKAKPWDLTLGSDSFDFRKATISARLVVHDTEAAVETRTAEPLGFSVRPNSSNGKTCAVEVRVGVLSSQMEGALFSIHFTAESKGAVASCLTEPIRVVSKKSQLEKSQPKRSRTSQVATRDAVLSLIEKIEEENSASTLARLAKQNDQILALLRGGKKARADGQVSIEDEEDSSISVSQAVHQPTPLQAFVAAYASDRSLLSTHLAAMNDDGKSAFRSLLSELAGAAVAAQQRDDASAESAIAAVAAMPFSPPMPFPDFRMGSVDQFTANLFEL